jgi:hypothetical protein
MRVRKALGAIVAARNVIRMNTCVYVGQIRGLNPRTKKWEPYTRLTRLARWGCSLLIHMLESVVRLHGKQRTTLPAPHAADTAVLAPLLASRRTA